MRKICFFDIDGTIMSNDGKLTAENIAALRALRQRGHLVFICTGRATSALFKEVLEIGWDGMICSAGGYVFVEDTLIFENSIPQEIVYKFIQLFQERNILIGLEAKDKYYQTEGFLAFYDKQYHREQDAALKRNRRYIEEYDGTDTIAKFNFISYDKEALMEVIKEAEQDFKVIFYADSPAAVYNGELIPKHCTKAEGIKHVLEYLNADIKDTLSFGDSMNDYEMLNTTDKSYTSVISEECLKEVADGVFDIPERSGIAKLLKELELI